MTTTAAPAYPSPAITTPAAHRPATRSTGDDAKAVASALKSEWGKA